MRKQTSVLRQLNDPTLNDNQRVKLRCQIAKELEEAGNFEAAMSAMGELWQRIGEHPNIAQLDQHTSAEVLLRAGALASRIGNAKQVEGAQEIAKNLISESTTIFEALRATEKVAEARIELSICYWREGAFDEARVMLQDVLKRINDQDIEQKARALLNSAIVEISANRYRDALHILSDASSLFQASNNHVLKGKFHMNLGIVLKNLNEGENREDYVDRALVEYAAASYYFEQASHTRFRAHTEKNLGFLLFTLSRLDQAYEHLERSRRLFASLKDTSSVAQVDETRARVLVAQRRYSEAEKAIRGVVRTLEKGDQPLLLAEALTTQGTALARLNHFEQARATLKRAVHVAEQAGALSGAGLAALTMIEELEGWLAPEELHAAYERADHLLADSQHPKTLRRLREAARRVLAGGRVPQGVRGREFDIPNFVYESAQMSALLRNAHRIAGTSSAPVLITGETGTGKEMLARFIHEWSQRPGKFVAVNCAALTETLIESQLFGHMKGSFRDAVADYPGAVRQARSGTLFLDEIGELSTGNQGKLLRLIERGEVHSIGAPLPERVDVRIIVATNCNLKEEVAGGLFRKDLFYRLQTFHLEILPLRERPEDLNALARYFIKEATDRHGQRVTFTTEAIEAICKLSLKGNARELRSLIESSVLTAPYAADITRETVETLVLSRTQTPDLADAWAGCVLSDEVLSYESNLIRLALHAARGQVTRAAHLLGVSHQRLSSILQGRHKHLLSDRTPVQRRRRSIFKIG
jgi:DNA-binding NtrC family response regulator/Tfp pilus assembly protein PilF